MRRAADQLQELGGSPRGMQFACGSMVVHYCVPFSARSAENSTPKKKSTDLPKAPNRDCVIRINYIPSPHFSLQLTQHLTIDRDALGAQLTLVA
jgi:hypothetical protein